MKKVRQRRVFDATIRGSAWLALATICVMLVVSCGGGGGGGGGSSSTGTVNVTMTDAATTDYKAVYVTVARVDVCRGQTDYSGCWETVGTPNKTYDLLTLVNGALETLGQTTLPTGQYSQVRLILKDTADGTTNILGNPHPYPNYFIDTDDNEQELRVPSGYQTGIKIVRGFEIDPNQTTELILDFDAARSIVKAGSSGHWNLKPTIKVLDTALYSRISGTVRYGSAGESGVLVSAQVYSAGTITAAAVTVSDADGNFTLFLEPGTYRVVAYKDEFVPAYSASKVIVAAGQLSSGNDLTLTTALMGSVSGSVFMSGASSDEYATIGLRQTISGSEQIGIKALYVTNGSPTTAGTFTTPLPVGSYVACISSPSGVASTPQEFTISAGGTTTLQQVNF